jgi:hypothetical protein
MMSAACCDKLTRVVQNSNELVDTGAEMIGEGLRVNSSLRQLHLVSFYVSAVFVSVVSDICFGFFSRELFR